MTITRVHPVSFARIAAVIYGAIGLLVGTFIALAALAGSFVPSMFGTAQGFNASPLIGVLVGGSAFVVCPVFYAALGFLFAFIGAWIYNLVASRVGGITVDVA